LVKELDAGRGINLKRFYFRRTLRIFPAFYFLLLSMVVLRLLGGIEAPGANIVAAFTYTTNYCFGCAPMPNWYLGHSWSLSVEEQFYLLWPLTLFVLGKRRGAKAAGCLLLLCPLARLCYFLFFPRIIADGRFEAVADSLAVGCLLALIRPALRKQKWYSDLTLSPFFSLVPVAVFCLTLMGSQTSRGIKIFYSLFGLTLVNVGVAACVDWCITNHSSRLGRLLNARPVALIGVMSYSLYLWQQVFLNPFSSSPASRFPLNVILACVAAFASYKLVERPSLRLRGRIESAWSGRRRKSAAAARAAEAGGLLSPQVERRVEGREHALSVAAAD
jgi:peptidoglycan/LPS O-acetylase OafA/YrhL